jgi:hypothetical protein
MVTQKDVIKPLIFLDIFDYPPTAMEVWRFLGVPAELGEVVDFLSQECHPREGGDPEPAVIKLDSRLRGNDNGFYFLPGREGIAEKRQNFFQLSEKKFKIAKRAAWLLHFIPSIKMIAVCNNFYYRPQSDIDFFIITAPKRLWLTRFFATIILDIFRLRARGKKTADKVCLSFYLSEDNLNLESVVLKPDDPYFSYWLAFLEPIYGQECYNKFWQANGWIKNIFPNILPKEPVARRQVGKILSQSAGRDCDVTNGFFYWLGNFLEKIAKKIQWWKISPRIKEMSALDDTRVVINDAMLKFHENDRREEFRKKFEDKISEFISSESPEAGRF